jgi:glycosyltransferase involved in cell wall biosynthesis
VIRASIIIATRNHAPLLKRTLESIFQQAIPFDFEVVITDDGSTDVTPDLLREYPVRSFRLDKDNYGNPMHALNNSMRESRGAVLIKQSDDVIHAQPRMIAHLISSLIPGEMSIASVQDWDVEQGLVTTKEHVGPHNQRPLFFLGACWRSDICKVGGYDEEAFANCRWYHDNWLADCLTLGLGVRVRYPPLIGLHQSHPHLEHDFAKDKLVYDRMLAAKKYQTGTAPWPYRMGLSVNEVVRAKDAA